MPSCVAEVVSLRHVHRRGRRTARSEQLTLRPGTGRIGGRTANATTWAAPLRCSAWRGKIAGVQVGVLGSSLRQRSGTCTMILLSDAQGICFCFCFCFCICFCAKHLNAYQLVLRVQDVVVCPPLKPTTVEYCGVLWSTITSMAIRNSCGLAAVPTTELRRAPRSERLIRRDD